MAFRQVLKQAPTLLLIAVISACGGQDDALEEPEAGAPVEVEDDAPPTPQPVNQIGEPTRSGRPMGNPFMPPYITLEQFEQLEEGMTMEEVVAILGHEGERTSHLDMIDPPVSTYEWKGVKEGTFMSAMFEGGKFKVATHVGLE